MSSEKRATSDTSSTLSTSTTSSLKALIKKIGEANSPKELKQEPVKMSEEQKRKMSEEQRRTKAEARAAYFSLKFAIGDQSSH